MKPPNPALAVALLCLLVLSSCGGAGVGASTKAGTDEPAPATGIAGFGRPARGSEGEAIVATIRGYLLALTEGEGSQACGYLASSIRSELAGLGAAATTKPTGCGAQLNKMTRGMSPGDRQAERSIRVSEVREAARRAFVIYEQSGLPLQFFPLVHEGGTWRLAALGGSTLPDGAAR
jgi:hypothetical protein